MSAHHKPALIGTDSRNASESAGLALRRNSRKHGVTGEIYLSAHGHEFSLSRPGLPLKM